MAARATEPCRFYIAERFSAMVKTQCRCCTLMILKAMEVFLSIAYLVPQSSVSELCVAVVCSSIVRSGRWLRRKWDSGKDCQER